MRSLGNASRGEDFGPFELIGQIEAERVLSGLFRCFGTLAQEKRQVGLSWSDAEKKRGFGPSARQTDHPLVLEVARRKVRAFRDDHAIDEKPLDFGTDRFGEQSGFFPVESGGQAHSSLPRLTLTASLFNDEPAPMPPSTAPRFGACVLALTAALGSGSPLGLLQ